MLEPRRASNGLCVYVSPLLTAAGVPHGFSTRGGGVSTGPFESLNLGIAREVTPRDSVENVEENYRRFMAATELAGRDRCWVSQVHGRMVCDATKEAPFTNGPQADALVTDDPARALSVKYADCVPILLATHDGAAVAAVHSGWRGVIAGVLPAAIVRLTDLADTSAASLLAAIGPCIGFDAFEVGPEVLASFESYFGPDAPLRRRQDGKGHVDLRGAVRLQLLRAGLSAARIDITDRCTFGKPQEFFSHRRDHGLTGRMAAIIGPRKPA